MILDFNNIDDLSWDQTAIYMWLVVNKDLCSYQLEEWTAAKIARYDETMLSSCLSFNTSVDRNESFWK